MKKSNKKYVLILLLFVGLYWGSRLINLTNLPIFTDEAIYLRWAQIALHDPQFRFISLTDGKQPSFIWIVMILMHYIADPLLAGRLASVAAGFLGMIGMYFLGFYLFRSEKVGIWSAFLYLISPFFLMYDRLALYDTLTAAFTIWSLFISIMLVRTVRLDVALILGLVLGGGLLTKSSAFFNVAFLPATLILFSWKKFELRRFISWLGLAGLASIMALIIYNALRLSPWFYIIGRKNREFVYSVAEWLTSPFQYFSSNLWGLSQWLWIYLTAPIVILILAGLVWNKKYLAEKLFLLITFLFPFLYLSFFGKVLFPRFLLFMSVPLYIMAAYGLSKLPDLLKNSLLLLGVYFLLLIYPALFSYRIIFNPVSAPLPDTERYQYLDNWPAGFGVSEAVSFLKKEALKQEVFVATEGTFGLFPAAIEIYFYADPRVEIKGYWPMTAEIIYKELVPKAASKPTYLIFKETQQIPKDWPLKLVLEVPRGKGETFLRMYQVLPQ